MSSEENKKIAVLASGGVDSSVALCMLKEQGFDVTAFYLKIWLEDELAFLGECPWEEDLKYVEEICKEWDIPLEIVPFQKEYWDNIVKYTIAEVDAGRTPNPDVLCNQRVKFGAFYDYVGTRFDKIATGHYAQTEEVDGKIALKIAPDPIKDQTYFLGYLSQEQLSKAVFPIGHLSKAEVRDLAKKYNIPNQDRKDSQGICFLGKIKFRDFVKHHLGEKKGDIVELETGKKLGEHDGTWFYTIGQRRGLYLPDGPWFVVKKDLVNNIVYISHEMTGDKKHQDTFEIAQLNWITGVGPERKDLKVKVRHGEKLYNCEADFVDNDRMKIQLDEGDQGIAAGQFAILYDGEECLGGGIIQ